MHHHKGDKSDKDLKHYSHMMENLEKAMESQESLDKYMIEEKNSEDPTVKNHFKAHNRIIHQIKKQKEKTQVEMLQLFNYGFDRTPTAVWKNVLENNVKKLHAHHHKKEIVDSITKIKEANQFFSMVKNALKDTKENELCDKILNLGERLTVYQKFMEDLMPYPLRKFDKSKYDILGNVKNNLLEVRSVYQAISNQFQKLKAFEHLNVSINFGAAVRSKLIDPLDTALKQLANKTKSQQENDKKISQLKIVIKHFADNKWDKVSDSFPLDYNMSDDIRKIKKQMEINCKKGFQIYKKINAVTSEFAQKHNQLKPQEKGSAYLLEIESQIKPILDFCGNISSLAIIKQSQSLEQYRRMRNNYSYFDIMLKILKDYHAKTSESQTARTLETATNFASWIYSLVILKKEGYNQSVPLQTVLAQRQRVYSQIKNMHGFKQRYQQAERSIREKENDFVNIRTQYERATKDFSDYKRGQQSEMQKYIFMHKQVSRIANQYKKQIETKNGLIFEKDLAIQSKDRIIESKDQMIEERSKEMQAMVSNFSKQLSQLQSANKAQLCDNLELSALVQKIKQFVQQKLKDIPEQTLQTQFANIDDKKELREIGQKLMNEHSELRLFVIDLFGKLDKKIAKVPYHQHVPVDLTTTLLTEIIPQLNTIMKFVLDVFDLFTSMMSQTKLWNGDRELASMVSKNSKEFDEKLKQMWNNDLKMCAKLFINRNAVQENESQMQNSSRYKQ